MAGLSDVDEILSQHALLIQLKSVDCLYSQPKLTESMVPNRSVISGFVIAA